MWPFRLEFQGWRCRRRQTRQASRGRAEDQAGGRLLQPRQSAASSRIGMLVVTPASDCGRQPSAAGKAGPPPPFGPARSSLRLAAYVRVHAKRSVSGSPWPEAVIRSV